ncbi:MAG: nuclear transport factor 2 family protein, partial [Bacteroidota bacterium]
MLRRSLLVPGLAVALLLSAGFFLAQRSSDVDAVRVPLKLYTQAHATGDASYVRRAFHPDATISWVRDDIVEQESLDKYAARFSGKPARDEAERQRRIAFVDVSGDVATARIELDYPYADI